MQSVRVRFSCWSPLASAAPGPDCGKRIRFHCCSPFASASSCCFSIAPASAAARRVRPLQLLLPIESASAATPRLRPLQLLLPDCVCFNCCSPDCVRFNCCSPDCVRFDCCSPIAYIRLLDSSPCPGPMFSNILRGVRGSVNKLKYEGSASLESNPAPRTSHFRHSHTDTR